MHPSAMAHMSRLIETYLRKDRSYQVLDFGSRISANQRSTHRDLLAAYSCSYTGVDVLPGRNVDLVMRRPYRIPLPSNSVDVVLTGQVFEHVPFFWASFMELARVLRPGGYIFMTVPSRGHTHDVYDCWRFYPDSMRALAALARLELKEGSTDLPPEGPDGRRFDYAGIDARNAYWGDTAGVFRKPEHYRSREVWLFREVSVWWANRVGDLSGVTGTDVRHPARPREPLPPPRNRRSRALRSAYRTVRDLLQGRSSR